ncbi:hypothetical protein CHI12_06800 [Terribacillus saccharophilus]|jgi:hypothetical protein|uniref:Uncharacterized protein n=2 Tax=Terribacillus saccharophilus TaxID=361277 RepID=A0A268HEN0_9BACI|nr:hypothetical protein CHI12_06800 [Terribacillus saccharophilus]
MYLKSGFILLFSSFIMFFFIDLFSRVFPVQIEMPDDVVTRGYYGSGATWYPVIAAIIGLALITLHFVLKDNRK